MLEYLILQYFFLLLQNIYKVIVTSFDILLEKCDF